MSYDFHTSKTVKAIKQHKCEHCRGIIKSGSYYIKSSGAYEGQIYSIKSHAYCEQIRNEVISVCGIEYGDEIQELPQEIIDSIHINGMPEIAMKYNEHAKSVDGVEIDLQESNAKDD